MFGGFFGLIHFVAAIWVVYDVWTQQKSMNQNTKLLWTICGVLLVIIGPLLYYFVVKKK